MFSLFVQLLIFDASFESERTPLFHLRPFSRDPLPLCLGHSDVFFERFVPLGAAPYSPFLGRRSNGHEHSLQACSIWVAQTLFP